MAAFSLFFSASIFGSAAAKPATGFGSTTTTGFGGFGSSAATTQPTTGGGIFGGFGSTGTQQAATQSPFGSVGTTTASPFGQTSTGTYYFVLFFWRIPGVVEKEICDTNPVVVVVRRGKNVEISMKV